MLNIPKTMISLFQKLNSANKNQTERRRLGIDLKRRDSLLMLFWGFTALRPSKNLLAAENRTTDTKTNLSIFLDTLIPADHITPSASAVGVTDDILTIAANDKLLNKLITLGCQWLDLQTEVRFSELPEEYRIRLLEWMSNAGTNSLPRKFFVITRHLAMSHYYRKPDSWKGLPVSRPPQPIGYPDFGGRHHDQ